METYREAVVRLSEWGKRWAEIEAERAKLLAVRDEMIRSTYKSGVSKTQISKLTGASWATVDRAVRAGEAQSED